MIFVATCKYVLKCFLNFDTELIFRQKVRLLMDLHRHMWAFHQLIVSALSYCPLPQIARSCLVDELIIIESVIFIRILVFFLHNHRFFVFIKLLLNQCSILLLQWLFIIHIHFFKLLRCVRVRVLTLHGLKVRIANNFQNGAQIL